MHSVPVTVIGIGHMRVLMAKRCVPMHMAVLSRGHGVVVVIVMAVAVSMGVLVLQHFMLMLMAMGLGQVQHHAGQQQHAAQRHQPIG